MTRVFRGEIKEASVRDRMYATEWLADRGFGRPVQGVESFEIDLKKLTNEQLERIANGEHPALVLTGQS